MLGSVGDRIRFLRSAASMSQKDLAFCIDKTLAAVSNYETNTRQPSISDLELINKAVAPKIGDQLFFLVTGKQPAEYLTVQRISSNYVERSKVIKAFESWIEAMLIQNEIKIRTNAGDMVASFAAKLPLLDGLGEQKNGTL